MIRELVPVPPDGGDDLAARALRPGPLRDVLVGAYGRIRLDWRGGRGIQGRALRDARHLGSKERRFAGDLLTFLARHHRTIATLLEAAGLSESATSKQIDLARVIAACILRGGGRPVDGPAFDAGAIEDPVHTLTGWARGRDEAEVYGVAASLPEWLASELVTRPDAVPLAAALNVRAPLVLRVNVPGATLPGGTPTAYAKHGLGPADRADVYGIPEVREGRLEVQDEGSQLVAEICRPQPGERILDLCAGALGKSLALAALTGDAATIDAFDVRRDAVKKGLKRARRCGFSSIRPTGKPSGAYDLVLADVPCTGTGALRRRPWAKWSITARDAATFPDQQLAILRRGAGHLKPGARLIYATCSLRSAENEEVVNRLLAERSDLTIEPIEDERIADDAGALRVAPHTHGTDGFYAAVLRKDDG